MIVYIFLIFAIICGDAVVKAEYDVDEDADANSDHYHGDGGSYSYHKFSGPVSGQVHRVVVNDPYHPSHQRVDFIAKPDYSYSYGVEDPKHGNSQTHHESRNGDAVIGEYRVLQADGLIRIVKYTADPVQGFKATIEYERA